MKMSKRIALLNFRPKFCPNCGEGQNLGNKLDNEDFLLGAAYECLKCGLDYGYAESGTLLDSHDDLKRYSE